MYIKTLLSLIATGFIHIAFAVLPQTHPNHVVRIILPYPAA